jgi:hypothetical protein
LIFAKYFQLNLYKYSNFEVFGPVGVAFIEGKFSSIFIAVHLHSGLIRGVVFGGNGLILQ